VSSSGALPIAIVVMLALNAYAVLAGADFGGGVWDLFAAGRNRDLQRRLCAPGDAHRYARAARIRRHQVRGSPR